MRKYFKVENAKGQSQTGWTDAEKQEFQKSLNKGWKIVYWGNKPYAK
jgi:hypothetical protein